MSSISEYNCPLQGVIVPIRVSREGGRYFNIIDCQLFLYYYQ